MFRSARRAFEAALLALLLPAAGTAQAPGDPVIIGYEHTLRSEVLGEERTFFIGLPAGYDRTDDVYPALYVLDGTESRFHDVTGMARTLADQGRMPPVVVVAVPSTDRNHDLTPRPTAGAAVVPPTAGGADAFLRFLTDELIPYVEAEFQVTHHRTLVGVSFGGLFAVYALVETPSAFDGYIAISPSLWWDDRAMVHRLTTALQRPDVAPKHLVLTIADEGALMREPIAETVEVLGRAAPAVFEWSVFEVPDETHTTSAHRATWAGLLAVFDDWAAGDDVAAGGVQALERLQLHRARKYGVHAGVPTGGYFALGWRQLDGGDPEQAITTFERALESEPQHPPALAGLGMAQARLGRLDDALLNLRRAVELAESTSHPMLAQIRAALAAVEVRIR